MKQLAANDEFFYAQRCRTLPILTTITYIPNYPSKLRIFLTNASRYWQVRCYFNGVSIIRSLRTTSKQHAIQLAKEFYNARIVTYTAPIAHNTQRYTVETVADLMLATEYARMERKEIAADSYKMLMSRTRKYVVPYFGSTDIRTIQHADIQQFLNFLSSKNYKAITLGQYLNALRKILLVAQNNGWLEKIPSFPKVKSNSTPRGGFSCSEYLLLLRRAKHLSKLPAILPKVTHRTTRNSIYALTNTVPIDLVWLIGFMVNSFVRPADIRLLKHKHVEIVRSEQTYLRLTMPETKKHTAPIVTLQSAVRIYQYIHKHYSKEGLANADNYVFLPRVTDRTAALRILETHFRKVLEDTGLRYGALNQKRTIYSLRHTAITFRLLYGQGIDLLTLARNARTSVEMIERFYASQLTPEMNIEMLHSRR